MKTAMNAPPERTIRKFNPGTFQSDEELIEQFVVRQNELSMVMETLRGNIGSPSCQHLLIVAPRGRGKTMLLARTAAEIRTNSELSEQLLPVRFMEESHEVFNMADFWLETLFHLAREMEGRDPNIEQELRETHSDLAQQWRGGDLEGRARCAVLETADRLNKQLVLMVENLQEMNNAVDDRFGWKLRQTLQTEPQIMLLATATTRFKGLDDVEQPFFELFRTISLDLLDTEESRLLWQMASVDKVGERAFRPFQILTGGDPRLLVTIAQFTRHRSMRELLEGLVSLIDDHTEYFRAHLEGFAKTERRVYLAVIDLWQPSTANEIAARARMDIRATSSLLGRLVDRGAVAADGRGKARRYVAVQRLYSIYYKMRHERGDTAVINHLIDFMIEFYSPAELIDVLATPIESTDERVSKAQVFDKQGVRLLENAQPEEAIRAFDEAVKEVRHLRSVEARQVAATAMINKGCVYLELDKLSDAAALFDQAVKQLGGKDAAGVDNLAAIALVSKGSAQIMMGDPQKAVLTFEQIVQRYSDDPSIESRRAVARALLGKGKALLALGRTESALDICNELARTHGDLNEKGGVSFAWQSWWIKAIAFLHRQQVEQAANIFRGLYSAFDPANPDMFRVMTTGVIELVTKGMPEREVIDILMIDQEKSDVLAPLVVALRQRQGEVVNSAAEISAVADDVRKAIESGNERHGSLLNRWFI